MDRLGLEVLRREMEADCGVFADAVAVAREHMATGGRAGHEATAFQLVRSYNTVELLAQRVARAFENHIDPGQGWHVELLRRLSLDIPGVRPALFPSDLLPALQKLRGFRHVIRHAYDLQIDFEELKGLMKKAEEVEMGIEDCCSTFCSAVSKSLSTS